VIFDEKKAPGRHTEVLDLQDLDHLLQGGDRSPHLSFFTEKRALTTGGDDSARIAETAAS